MPALTLYCFRNCISTQPFFFSRVELGGSESVGGHLRGDKERSFSSVTHFDRVCSKVPERDAGTVA